VEEELKVLFCEYPVKRYSSKAKVLSFGKINLQIEYKRRREYLNTFKIPIYNKLILTYLIMLIIGSLLTTLPAFVFNIFVFFWGKSLYIIRMLFCTVEVYSEVL
jgi:hypothetical protein